MICKVRDGLEIDLSRIVMVRYLVDGFDKVTFTTDAGGQFSEYLTAEEQGTVLSWWRALRSDRDA